MSSHFTIKIYRGLSAAVPWQILHTLWRENDNRQRRKACKISYMCQL